MVKLVARPTSLSGALWWIFASHNKRLNNIPSANITFYQKSLTNPNTNRENCQVGAVSTFSYLFVYQHILTLISKILAT
jgi:hypothetical protein